jgi:CubicO group peptidase (beta-lactamase class C family)
MRRLAWILVVLVLATVGALAMNVGNIRRDALALLAGADAVAYAEPRVSVAAEPGPPQPKVSPAEAGIDMAAIQQAVDYAATRDTRALVIGQGGHIVFEKYWDDSSLETPVDLSGFTPVLSGLLLGTVMYGDRGLVLDAPLSEFIDAWKNDERGTVTLRELLSAEGGFVRVDGWPLPGSLAARYAVRGDLRAALLAWPRDPKLPNGETPADVSADILALALEKRPGPRYASELSLNLFKPLGIGGFSMGHDAGQETSGRIRAGCCLRMNIGDWMRIGELLANDGVFEGSQLMPPGFVKQMLSPTRKDSPVGWFTRVDGQFATPNVARLESKGKQRLWIVPSLRLVILRIGDEPPDWDEAMIPDSIIRGTRGWEPTKAGEGVDPNKFAPH